MTADSSLPTGPAFRPMAFPVVPLLAAILLVTAAGCGPTYSAPTYSALTLEPGGRFVLSGEGDVAFRADLENEGPVPVTLAERTPDGRLAGLGVLGPGARRSVRLRMGSAAVFLNLSPTTEARLVVTGRNSSELTMRSLSPGD